MPIYEYQCATCRDVCEVLQKAKDKPPEKCPKCGGRMVKRISSPAIQFKGTGWYITDYAKKSSTPGGNKVEAGRDGKSGAKPEAKSEPAPEARAEAKAGPAAGDKPKSGKSSS